MDFCSRLKVLECAHHSVAVGAAVYTFPDGAMYSCIFMQDIPRAFFRGRTYPRVPTATSEKWESKRYARLLRGHMAEWLWRQTTLEVLMVRDTWVVCAVGRVENAEMEGRRGWPSEMNVPLSWYGWKWDGLRDSLLQLLPFVNSSTVVATKFTFEAVDMSKTPATPVIEKNDASDEDEQSRRTKYEAFTEFWRTLGQPASNSATAHDIALPSKTEFSKFFMRSGPEDNEEFLRSICRGILSHDRAEEQGGAIGREIDRSQVIPSITRPAWEPPALEVLDSFEVVDMKSLKRSIPDPAARSRWLDIGGEMMALINYYEWAEETLTAAETTEDHEKEAFYGGLLQEVYDDLKEVYLECREFLLDQCNGPWLSRRELFMQLIRMMDEWFDMGRGPATPGSKTSSATSYTTAIDESCPYSMEEMGDLIDLDSSNSDDGNDLDAIIKSTRLGELGAEGGGPQPSPRT